MKNRNSSRRRNAYHRSDQEEIRIKERKKSPKKIKKQHLYDLIEEEKHLEDVDLYSEEEEM